MFATLLVLDTSPCVTDYRNSNPKYWDPCSTTYPTCSFGSSEDDFEGAARYLHAPCIYTVCMYVSIYVFMCVCMEDYYVLVHVCIYDYIYEFLSICVCMSSSLCMYVCIYYHRSDVTGYVCMNVRMYSISVVDFNLRY